MSYFQEIYRDSDKNVSQTQEMKQTSQALFNKVNQTRRNLGLSELAWEEMYYQKALEIA